VAEEAFCLKSAHGWEGEGGEGNGRGKGEGKSSSPQCSLAVDATEYDRHEACSVSVSKLRSEMFCNDCCESSIMVTRLY